MGFWMGSASPRGRREARRGPHDKDGGDERTRGLTARSGRAQARCDESAKEEKRAKKDRRRWPTQGLDWGGRYDWVSGWRDEAELWGGREEEEAI